MHCHYETLAGYELHPVNVPADSTGTGHLLKQISQQLPANDPVSFNSYHAVILQRFAVKDYQPVTPGMPRDSTASLVSNDQTPSLFSSETLTNLKHLKPGFEFSKQLSAKFTGKAEPFYSKLAVDLHDFSLLRPVSVINGRGYLSPFCDEAFASYNYSRCDSVIIPGDTVCLIEFHPKSGIGDGFSGKAIIDAKKFAVRQVNAQTTGYSAGDPIVFVEQNFQLQEGRWLPYEKKVSVLINHPGSNNQKLLATSTAQTFQQLINPPLTPGDFKTPSAKQAAYGESVSNNQAKMIRMIAEGKIPLGYFYLDYNKIFGYNLFEGIKIGLGGETSRMLSEHFTVGGYISYGLRDKSVRHGEWINIFPSHRPDLRIHLGYKDMNLEFGNPEFLEIKSLLNPESYRTLLTKNMFSTKRYSTGVEFRPFNDLNIYVFGDHSENQSRQNSSFSQLHPFGPVTLSRTGLQLRYSPGIKLGIEDGHLNELKEPVSDYFLTAIQGIGFMGSESRYTKLEVKGKFNLPFRKMGITTVMLRGGTISKEGPVIELFNGYGSMAGKFTLIAPYSFATMQLNEFAASQYTALHLRHNFSPWLFGNQFNTRPGIIFAQNIGVGLLNNHYKTQFNFNDYRDGFYESGLEINNLLRMNFLSWGAGVYYRYGPYRMSRARDNFAWKFGFFFKL